MILTEPGFPLERTEALCEHLVSLAGADDAAMACTTCTVHTFAQLVKLCTKGFLTFGLVAVNMHRARCESCTKDECTD